MNKNGICSVNNIKLYLTTEETKLNTKFHKEFLCFFCVKLRLLCGKIRMSEYILQNVA